MLNALPLTQKTKGLFNYEFFKRMKKSAVMINVGRGKSIIEDDLIRSIKEGLIYGAALDVYASEPLPETSALWEMDRVLMTYHNITNTEQYWDSLVEGFKNEVLNFINGKGFNKVFNKAMGY